MPATSAAPSAGPDQATRLSAASVEQKYSATSGAIYLSGIQALVRLPMLQHQRDLAAGLDTAGFVSGYRASPLGGLDEQLWHAAPHLARHHVRLVPGVNQELAAKSVWGAQTVDLIGPARYDGVFAMWYGKGPGLDRCADLFKHMNHAGSARHGGVLLVAGDDHGANSSTLPHQSDHLFAASMIPLLYPRNVEEYFELGLHGWAMSRFSGCAIALNGVAVESNQRSFLWGRRAVVERDRVEPIAMPGQAVLLQMPQRLEQLIADRVARLTAYQNPAYAARYQALVDQVSAAEKAHGADTTLTRAVALSYFNLMTYKDEYEVARLYTDGQFMADLAARFEGDNSLRFHLAPPLLARKDADGRPVKTTFGPWIWHAFRLMARCKRLRGGPFDVFGYTHERRTERALIEYRLMIEALLPTLSPASHARAVALASLAQQVRGFGHVKQKTVEHFRAQKAALSATARVRLPIFPPMRVP